MNTARRFLIAFACVAVLSCGTVRRTPTRTEMTLVDSLWTFSQSHPDGFTLYLATWKEPVQGISVAYEDTQGLHNRSGLEFVISHSQSHEGYVGGWFNSQDSLYYFGGLRPTAFTSQREGKRDRGGVNSQYLFVYLHP